MNARAIMAAMAAVLKADPATAEIAEKLRGIMYVCAMPDGAGGVKVIILTGPDADVPMLAARVTHQLTKTAEAVEVEREFTQLPLPGIPS